MATFKYKTNCTRNNMFVPFASDTNDCATKTEALKYMKNLESNLADAINEQIHVEISPMTYFILGDFTVIATASMYDNAKLIAEAFAMHSPYYKEIDVMSSEGLLVHYICKDCKNDRTNHL